MTEEQRALLKKLHAIHIKRYATRLARAIEGQPNFNKSELEHYLNLWTEVEAKGFDFEKLSMPAKEEVVDAVMDEGAELPDAWLAGIQE